MTVMNDILFAGVLQDMGLPYVLLYVDSSDHRFYIFIRISKNTKPEGRYVAVKVTAQDVRDYMRRKVGLSTLVLSRGCFEACIVNDRVMVSSFCNVMLPERSRLDFFNPDLCDDEDWIETILESSSKGIPLIPA